jgi:lipopolysaccharide cholinephosphotransferase
MNKETALRNLIELDLYFRSKKINYWLTAGTLLGCYREGDFIGHDTDVDLCVDAVHITPEFFQGLIRIKFEISEVFGQIKNGFMVSIVKHKLKVDIYFFYTADHYSYHSVYSHLTELFCIKHDYVYDPPSLIEVSFLGHKFFVPQNTRSYIVQQYGDKFMSPVKDWSYVYSPKNVIHTEEVIGIFDTLTDIRLLNLDITLDWTANLSSSDLVLSELAISKKNLKDLSLDELIDIFERVKRGEKKSILNKKNSIFLLKLAIFFLRKKSRYSIFSLIAGLRNNKFLFIDSTRIVIKKISSIFRGR